MILSDSGRETWEGGQARATGVQLGRGQLFGYNGQELAVFPACMKPVTGMPKDVGVLVVRVRMASGEGRK